MKHTLPLLLLLCLCGATRAQALFFETFTQGIPASWTLFNDQNTPRDSTYDEAWSVSATYGHPAPGAVSTSWFQSPATADRWMVAAPVVVPSQGYALIVEASAIEDVYADGFEVRVSTRGGDDRSLFSDPLMSVSRCESEWCDFIVMLDDYVGDSLWVALVQNSYDKHLLMVDNMRIARPDDPELELTALLLPDTVDSPFPLQAILTNKSQQHFHGDVSYSCTVNGEPVGSGTLTDLFLAHGDSYTFTTPDTLQLSDTLNRIVLTLAPVGPTDYEGNNSVSTAVTNTGQVVGLPTPERCGSLNIYPNPSHGTFAVEGAQGPVRIHDLRGRLAQQPLRPGTYVVTDGHSYKKLIITQ